MKNVLSNIVSDRRGNKSFSLIIKCTWASVDSLWEIIISISFNILFNDVNMITWLCNSCYSKQWNWLCYESCLSWQRGIWKFFLVNCEKFVVSDHFKQKFSLLKIHDESPSAWFLGGQKQLFAQYDLNSFSGVFFAFGNTCIFQHIL
jgi:hypothetical protein